MLHARCCIEAVSHRQAVEGGRGPGTGVGVAARWEEKNSIPPPASKKKTKYDVSTIVF
jgi:hypothetical protein